MFAHLPSPRKGARSQSVVPAVMRNLKKDSLPWQKKDAVSQSGKKASFPRRRESVFNFIHFTLIPDARFRGHDELRKSIKKGPEGFSADAESKSPCVPPFSKGDSGKTLATTQGSGREGRVRGLSREFSPVRFEKEMDYHFTRCVSSLSQSSSTP